MFLIFGFTVVLNCVKIEAHEVDYYNIYMLYKTVILLILSRLKLKLLIKLAVYLGEYF